MWNGIRFVTGVALVAVLATACNPAPSLPAKAEHEMDAPEMDKMASAIDASVVSRTVKGTGVVKAVDLDKGTVTLAHEPIEALGWPSMTMTFKVTPESLLQDVKAGQTVSFDVTITDNKPEITGLRAA